MDRPYCVQIDEQNWAPIKRNIQLEKQWDLYDLAQEFLSAEAKQYYFKLNEARPSKVFNFYFIY